MKLCINGEYRDLTGVTTVSALLEQLGLSPQATVVQRNDDILERARYADTELADGDTLELIRFVGGG